MAASTDEGSWSRTVPSSKLRDQVEQRRETRDRLVDTVRRYGTVVLAAAVLLPAQLALLALVGIAFVYICMRHVWPLGRSKMPTG